MERRLDRPNFTGYWRLLKTEGLDSFLKEVGLPWIVRKAVLRYSNKSADVICQQGSEMRVTSVNAKTSWSRCLVDGKEVSQRDSEGTNVRISSWWENGFHKSRMEGGRHGTVESWRYIDAGLMMVRTTLQNEQGPRCSVLWYMEEMAVPVPKEPEIVREDQSRIENATHKDNIYAQKLLKTMDTWISPADRYLAQANGNKKELLHMASSSQSPLSSDVSPRHSNQLTAEPVPHPRPIRHSRDHQTSAWMSRRTSDNDLQSIGLELCQCGPSPSLAQSEGKQPVVGTLQRKNGSLGQLSDAEQDTMRSQGEPLEVQLSVKLQEFAENRSITSVLPVENPLASDEPELLEMSPEEAEGTQLKVAELEKELGKIALDRQKYSAGRICCCCTLVFHSYVIPQYIKVWEL